MPIAAGGLVPKNAPACIERFMEAMIGSLKAAGFDLVKIDFVSSMIMWYAGAVEMLKLPADNARAADNPAQVSARLQQALEEAVARHGVELLNCNANGPSNLFNFSRSNVTRSCNDYAKGKRDQARSHLFHGYSIIPWLGQVAWGDHDMFHSCDATAGRAMAVSKAVSGGPVYLSDNPKDFVADRILPLCYADGELLRPLAPAAPFPEDLYADSESDTLLYRVIAPLRDEAAAVVFMNLSKAETELEAEIRPGDYAHAGCMMQPYPGPWAVPEEGLVLWDWYAACGERLMDRYAFRLAPLADRLLLLVPVRQGWAVVGRTDKYLAPVAAAIEAVSRRELTLRLVESGPFTIFSADGRPVASGLDFLPLGDGFWRTDMPVGTRGVSVSLRR